MKISNVAAIVAAAALSATLCAQGRPGGPPGGFGGRGRMSPQEQADTQTKAMTQFLNLTPAQQAKVKAIILKNAIMMKKIRDGQMDQIKKVLTADQAKKMASMPRGMGRGPGGPGGPPPPGGRRGG